MLVFLIGLQRESLQMENTLLRRQRVIVQKWHEEEDRLLTELWRDESIPAATIGERLSRSKNSIVGRAHRLGLPMRKTGPYAGRPRRLKRMDSKPIVVSPPAVPEPSKPWEPIGIPLLEAEAYHCRAIVGKDERGLALFCGHYTPLAGRLSFCAYHLKRYTYPPRQR